MLSGWRRAFACALGALALVAATGCTTKSSNDGISGSYELPDRTEPAVQAEERRLVATFRPAGALLSSGPATCRVRLLGRRGPTSYAWARCTSPSGEGASLAVRVDGKRVRMPEDGGGYGASLRKLFPPGIAGYLDDHPTGPPGR